jgi:hypothetical protein
MVGRGDGGKGMRREGRERVKWILNSMMKN